MADLWDITIRPVQMVSTNPSRPGFLPHPTRTRLPLARASQCHLHISQTILKMLTISSFLYRLEWERKIPDDKISTLKDLMNVINSSPLTFLSHFHYLIAHKNQSCNHDKRSRLRSSTTTCRKWSTRSTSSPTRPSQICQGVRTLETKIPLSYSWEC